MEAVESKSQSLKGFQHCVKEILTLLEKDEDFSEMTPEIYDFKKSQLTKLVNELSRMHGEVSKNTEKITTPIRTQHADSSTSISPQVTQTLTPNTSTTPVGFEITFSSTGGGFHISRRECSEFTSDSPVKETKVDDPDVLLKKISVLEDDLLSLQKKLQNLSEENSNLTRNLHDKESELQSEKTHLEDEKAKVVELKKQVLDLNLAISESNRKTETMVKVLEASRQQVLKADDEKSKIKQDMCRKYLDKTNLLQGQLESNHQEITSLRKLLDAQQSVYHELQKRVDTGVADISIRDDEIDQLNTKINLLKLSHAAIIDGLMADKEDLKVKVVELEMQMEVISEEKREVIKQLSFSLDHYMSEYRQLRESVFGNKTRVVLTS